MLKVTATIEIEGPEVEVSERREELVHAATAIGLELASFEDHTNGTTAHFSLTVTSRTRGPVESFMKRLGMVVVPEVA